jgi:hypothetical protein
MVWAAQSPQAANEAFNITNGDGAMCGRPWLKPCVWREATSASLSTIARAKRHDSCGEGRGCD